MASRTGEHARVVLPVAGGMHTHWPAWSADGKYLYFTRSAKSANSEPAEIHRVAVSGTAREETVIATSRRATLAFPWPNGRGLLYAANPTSVELALWWKPWSSEPVRLTTGVGEYTEARLSADGRRMVSTVYEINQGLARIPVNADATLTMVTDSTGDDDPAMSPEGDRLACSSTRSGDRNIWTMKPDGTDPRQVTVGAAIDERPAWSPDGRSLAFVSTRGDESSIWVVGADGGAPRRVLATEVLSTISWSPDGKEIVYAAPNGGTSALFRVPVEGGTPRIIPTPTAASSPHWSAVANAIAYTASVLPSGTMPGRTWLAVVRPTGEPVPLPHDDVRLGNGIVAWSPDGRFVAGLAIPGGARATLWVMATDGRSPLKLLELEDAARPRGITWSQDGSSLFFGLQRRTADIVLFEASQE